MVGGLRSDYENHGHYLASSKSAVEGMVGGLRLRNVTSTKKTLPNDDAVFKGIYMALINTIQKWTMPIQNWKPTMRQFVMLYEHRVEGN